MFKRISTAVAAAVLLTGATAQAAEIELTREIQGASIHEDGVDMVVYYTRADVLLEVVATYVEEGEAATPQRIRMGFMDGDEVTFALPGRGGTHYTFARAGETVRVTTRPTGGRIEIARATR